MPQNYNGSAAAITAHQQVTISEPVGTDVRNSGSVRTPLEKLADYLQFLQAKAALLDAINVFTTTQQLSGGDLELTKATVQALLKAGGGKLQLGTKAGNNSDLELLVNGVVKLALLAAGGIDAKSQKIVNVTDPASAQDADTKAAREAGDAATLASANALTDGKTGITWGWTQIGTVGRLYKTAAGIVHLYLPMSVPAGTPTLAVTLPVGYRPENGPMFVPGMNLSAPEMSGFSIATTGAITHVAGTLTQGHSHYLAVSFKAA